MSELAQLKSQLRSLVVSSPTAVDARRLLRDYRDIMGEVLPFARHGYRDPLLFLRERCNDCFVFQGPPLNPVLTLIVPDQLKHIDDFVQKQRMPSTKHIKGKRRSIPESYIRPPHAQQDNLIVRTFKPVQRNPIIEEPRPPAPKPVVQKISQNVGNCNIEKAKTENQKSVERSPHSLQTDRVKPEHDKENCIYADGALNSRNTEKVKPEQGNEKCNGADGSLYSRKILQRFLQRRTPLNEAQGLERAPSSQSLADDDSSRQTSSSSSSSKMAALERLKADITEIVSESDAGVWASSLMRLYEERFGRELNYWRYGFASIAALACALDTLAPVRSAEGDWLLRARTAGPAPPSPCPAPALRLRRAAPRAAPAALPVDPDDALPGIDYDPDVFPPDCMSFVDSIPAASVADVAPGDMIELVVGEVYSPSHLWILRLGPEYDLMEDIMDEMTEYFSRGEGAERVLAAGARRPGQYCSSAFEGDWHRSLIVQLVDADTVKVRHVDYGTVDTVPARALRPLRRGWGSLPAQAVRARLAGLRPPAAGRRWPRAAAAHCLRLVRDRRLVGNVVAVDHEESIVELFLIDTATAEDVNVSDELVRAGHADPRRLPALGAAESYLFPLFAALETGATPNYAEIHALLRDGIALDYVPAYREHVPSLLPPDPVLAPRAPRGPPVPRAPHPPDVPDVPTVSLMPHGPKVPDVPRVPHGPNVHHVPHPANVPDVSRAPDVPTVPRVPHGPNLPYGPNVTHTPRVPHGPNLSHMLHVADLAARSVSPANRVAIKDFTFLSAGDAAALPVVNRVPLPWGPSMYEPAASHERYDCDETPESGSGTDSAVVFTTEAVSLESISTPLSESIPVSEPTLVSKLIPVSEPIPVYKSIPVSKSIPASKTIPVSESIPVSKSIPISESIPESKSIPVSKSIPISESIPESKSIPVPKSIPVSESIPVSKSIPVPKSIPVSKSIPVPESIPVSKPVPVFKSIPVPESIPVSKPVPVFKSIPVPESIPVSKPVPVFKSIPVPESIPVSKPVPVFKSIPVPESIPVSKPVPVSKSIPVSESVLVSKSVPVSASEPVFSIPPSRAEVVTVPSPVSGGPPGFPARPAHPAAFYAAPQVCYKPCCPFPRPLAPYMPHPAFAQYRPFAPRLFPARPYCPPPARDVRLSAGECEVFELLSLVDKNAAHRYVAEALRRAQGCPAPPRAPLDPLAPEFRAAAGPQAELRPPPGFENVANAFR